MGSAGVVALGLFLGGLAFDVSLNAVQDWYQTMYADAMWSNRVQDSPALRALSKEEAEINRVLNNSEFASQQVVIVDTPAAPAGAQTR